MELKEAIKHLDETLSEEKTWSCEACRNEYIQLREWLKELMIYKELESLGLLVKLPCKVKNTVYRINKGAKNPVIPMEVREISIFHCANELVTQIKCRDYAYCGEMCYLTDDLEKILFLTQDQAEQVLRQQA